MSQDVVGEGHVSDRRLRRRPVLGARREEDGEAGLRFQPVVFKDVLIHQHSLGVLQLKKILDRPTYSGEGRIVCLPGEWFRDAIQAELYVRGDHARNRRRGSAKHNILARGLQVVVDDLEWPRRVPTADGLRIGADLMDVGDVRINYRRPGGTEPYAAPDIAGGVAVNIAAVDYQIARRLSQCSLIAAERDNVIVVRSRRPAVFNSDEP